jgi:hypothetical protein
MKKVTNKTNGDVMMEGSGVWFPRVLWKYLCDMHWLIYFSNNQLLILLALQSQIYITYIAKSNYYFGRSSKQKVVNTMLAWYNVWCHE